MKIEAGTARTVHVYPSAEPESVVELHAPASRGHPNGMPPVRVPCRGTREVPRRTCRKTGAGPRGRWAKRGAPLDLVTCGEDQLDPLVVAHI